MNSLFSESNHSSYGQKDARDAFDGARMAPGRELAVPPDVFRHDDYRAFLRARFAELQALDPTFSQRGLARKAGIANPGFFNEVIKGRRRLSPAAAIKMANGLELAEDETEYFSVLVEFAETREPRAKVAAGKRLIAMRHRKLFPALEGGPAPVDGLQDIVRELDREWVLQAAGLDVQPSGPGGSDGALQPLAEGTLRSILDRLVDIREQAADPEKREIVSPNPLVKVNLQVQPRNSAG